MRFQTFFATVCCLLSLFGQTLSTEVAICQLAFCNIFVMLLQTLYTTKKYFATITREIHAVAGSKLLRNFPHAMEKCPDPSGMSGSSAFWILPRSGSWWSSLTHTLLLHRDVFGKPARAGENVKIEISKIFFKKMSSFLFYFYFLTVSFLFDKNKCWNFQ